MSDMPAPTAWGDRALACTRDQFVAVYRHPFLYSTSSLIKNVRPQRTEKFDITTQIPIINGERPPAPTPLVYAVAKVQSAFPSMITIGRTNNNDVVIDDVQMSRFHAFFKQNGGKWELADAGSSNGTKLGGRPLEKGAPRPVQPGDLIQFGTLEFVFMTANAAWDRLVADQDEWDG